ncbi:hypothetical protein BHU16_05190 [Tannerella sp. oral taxon 808]|nr:hypothetical protein BHU16_05190 [Tannerella sp. oral taxon 808]
MTARKQHYPQYRADQLDKLGNTAVYLSARIPDLSKTKFLKLLYLLDERSILETGFPFLNLQYKVWKLGPVAQPVFVDLSSESTMLAPYVHNELYRTNDNDRQRIVPNRPFCDDEFSAYDIELMDRVISEYGKMTAKELVNATHRPGSLWYETARENGVLEALEKEGVNSTDYVIDMGRLVAGDPYKREKYESYREMF